MPQPAAKIRGGRIHKSSSPSVQKRRKLKRQEVLKLFSIMDKNSSAVAGAGTSSSLTNEGIPKKDLSNEFYNTGRVGRRNALPDILGENCTVSTADLPDRLGALTTDDKQPPGDHAGPSRVNLEHANGSKHSTEKS